MTVSQSDQLDLVDALWEHERTAEASLTAIEDALNVQIDANPEDKLLMEMLDVATDASESLGELRDLLATMQRRDQEDSL